MRSYNEVLTAIRLKDIYFRRNVLKRQISQTAWFLLMFLQFALIFIAVGVLIAEKNILH